MAVEAVILAAGYSSRAKDFKMALEIDGQPVLARTIEAFLPLCTRIIVVGGFQIERLVPIVKRYGDKVVLVENINYPQGMFSSVKVGVGVTKESVFFLTPGDYPLITTKLCKQLLLSYEGEIVIPCMKGRGGHPILLPIRCKNELLEEDDASNLKYYLSKNLTRRIEVEDEGILIDLDTPMDYENIKSKLAKKRLHIKKR